jgi:hypothetical protein
MIWPMKSVLSSEWKKTPVDDERAVVRHQRDVTEVDLLLLDVADGLDAGLGVLVPDHEPDGDLERDGIGHAPLLALVDVVLELQRHALAADLMDQSARLVAPSAWIPVADGVFDELERRVLAEVADRKDRLEDRLEPDVFALSRRRVHLQEALVRLLLDLDEVRDRNRGLDLRELDALPIDVLVQALHA